MTAIIIGGTSGLGEGVAQALVSKGWTVGITGRRLECLESFQQTYGPEKVFTQVMDITHDDACDALDALQRQTGAPDLFLHVSGIGYQNTTLEPDKELRTVKTNAEGMVRMVDHFIHYALSCGAYTPERKAHIAVVTSVAATAALGSAPAYSATKKMESTYVTALVQLTHMQKWPLLFSDIRPGFVATALLNPDKHYPLLMTREQAVRHILRGLRRKRRVIVFDWRYKVLCFFWKLLPRAIWERLTFVKN